MTKEHLPAIALEVPGTPSSQPDALAPPRAQTMPASELPTNMDGKNPSTIEDAKETVLSYIKGLEAQDYAAARNYLGGSVQIKGPAGEAFRSTDEFLKMMEQQRGTYDVKKIFVDGSDVCVLYDFVTPKVRTFFCSWYQVRDGKIVSIQTVFDPGAFERAADKRLSI